MTVNAILLFQVSLSHTQLKNFKLQYVSSSYKLIIRLLSRNKKFNEMN